jgi:hypothetical protein
MSLAKFSDILPLKISPNEFGVFFLQFSEIKKNWRFFKKTEQISREITLEEQKYPNFFVRKKSNVSPKNHWTDCWII